MNNTHTDLSDSLRNLLESEDPDPITAVFFSSLEPLDPQDREELISHHIKVTEMIKRIGESMNSMLSQMPDVSPSQKSTSDDDEVDADDDEEDLP
jgi:hypothetical protein